ncbi:hypothetical protein EUGRSUZ_C01781 [Eucalyptus grandis]|uniref:Uncharacterized protein n=3 Tax=Eucalyptus TaxID=3932 RepID=A0ACC3LDD0_EUCGR|nr:hypothetical protein EUGRSUZ_C01781 [Eucalyptus grandis]
MLQRMVDEKLVCCDVDMQITEIGSRGGGPESSFDVSDLGGVDHTLRNQTGRGSPLTIFDFPQRIRFHTFTENLHMLFQIIYI